MSQKIAVFEKFNYKIVQNSFQSEKKIQIIDPIQYLLKGNTISPSVDLR